MIPRMHATQRGALAGITFGQPRPRTLRPPPRRARPLLGIAAPCPQQPPRVSGVHVLKATADPSVVLTAVDTDKVDSQLEKQSISALQNWFGQSGDQNVTVHNTTVYPPSADFIRVAVSTALAGGSTPTHLVFACSAWVKSPGSNENAVGGLHLHWGCVDDAKKMRWRPPPSGWSTSPDYSVDAGGGAWQTPFEKQPAAEGSDVGHGDVWRMVLQIPLAGPLRSGGLCFVLKTSDGRWIKDGSSGKDFFLPTTEGMNQGADLSPAVQPVAAPKAPRTESSFSGLDDARKREEHKQEQARKKQAEEEGRRKKEEAREAEANQLMPFLTAFKPTQHPPESLLVDEDQDMLLFRMMKTPTSACRWMVDSIASREPGCERSLMHRYDAAAELLGKALSAPQEADVCYALVALVVWLRFSAARHLVWNKNYNIKPREISAAQDRLNIQLARAFEEHPELRCLVVMAMAAVGRGGQGDVGQRIRDDILSIQSRNNCKGGMMEEWHQKLHNNTSPDDVVICEALLAYMDEGLNIKAYWRVLQASKITPARLASYDRAIRSEPHFTVQQVPGLTRDLTEYLVTLRAVHSGADLSSAAANVMGFSSTSLKGKTVTVEPIPSVATPELGNMLKSIEFLQQHPDILQKLSGNSVASLVLMLNLIVEARHLLRPVLLAGEKACGGRLRDILFLDFALDSAGRTVLEGGIGQVRSCAQLLRLSSDPSTPPGLFPPSAEEAAQGSLPERLSLLLSLLKVAAEHVALGQYHGNVDLVMTSKYLNVMLEQNDPAQQKDRAMQAIAVVDRLKRSLSETASAQILMLQPSAVSLGEALKVPSQSVAIFSEEAVRGTSAAPLAQLLSVIEPGLRRMVGAGDWQLISRGVEKPVEGRVRVEASLASCQYEVCAHPTILVIDQISGHEEVPENVVAVLTSSDCPDILSHSAVRARNMGVLMAACFEEQVMTDIKAMEGSSAVVSLAGTKVLVQKKN